MAEAHPLFTASNSKFYSGLTDASLMDFEGHMTHQTWCILIGEEEVKLD